MPFKKDCELAMPGSPIYIASYALWLNVTMPTCTVPIKLTDEKNTWCCEMKIRWSPKLFLIRPEGNVNDNPSNCCRCISLKTSCEPHRGVGRNEAILKLFAFIFWNYECLLNGLPRKCVQFKYFSLDQNGRLNKKHANTSHPWRDATSMAKEDEVGPTVAVFHDLHLTRCL